MKLLILRKKSVRFHKENRISFDYRKEKGFVDPHFFIV
jgi:hypothetical protein